jgi:hypothetical protein
MNILDSTYIVTTPECGICKETGYVEVPAEGFFKWNFGMLIQDALPDLDKSLREQLKTGTHPKCWVIMTQGEEDKE